MSKTQNSVERRAQVPEELESDQNRTSPGPLRDGGTGSRSLLFPSGLAVGLALLLVLQPAIGALAALPGLGGAWIEHQKVTPKDADEPGQLGGGSHWGVHFGSEVAVDGQTLVVGTKWSPNSDSGEPENDGFDWAYVFRKGSDGMWTQMDKLVPSDAHQGDSFAYALSVDEEAGRLAAGNPLDREVYLFERRSPGDWVETTVLEGDVRDFGYQVSLDGDTLFVGGTYGPLAHYERGSEGWQRQGTYPAAGQVDVEGDVFVAQSFPNYETYDVYTRGSDGGWHQTAELPPPSSIGRGEPVAGAVDLAADGNTILFGASTVNRELQQNPGPAVNFGSSVGAAWIYERVGGTWETTATISNPDPAPLEGFGNSVALSGDRAVIGAHLDNHNGLRAGAVYVYDQTGEDWTLTSKLRNSDGHAYAPGDWFGESVAISEGTILAGAPFDDNRRDGTPAPLNDEGDVPPCIHRDVVWGCDEGEDAGSVYAFKRSGSPDRSLDIDSG